MDQDAGQVVAKRGQPESPVQNGEQHGNQWPEDIIGGLRGITKQITQGQIQPPPYPNEIIGQEEVE